MADSFIPRMDWDATDPSQALKLFKQNCELYFSHKDIKKEKQVDHILLFAGEPGLKFYNSWGLPEEGKKDPKVVWQRLETQIEPKTNFRVARLFLQQKNSSQTSHLMTSWLVANSKTLNATHVSCLYV